jgi:hypothetical protein|tara:strand:+ start:40 stop:540 length:501 start_codon:yes stop_codon:yes gene_type:complete
MSDEYEMVIGLYKQMVTVRDDFLRCPECDSSELVINTSSVNKGTVFKNDSVVIEFSCNECLSNMTLGLFNDNVGAPEPIARINWVQKHVPHKETALDKLKALSITGYSRQLTEYSNKYDLWDHRIGEPLPKGVPPFRPEDYPKKEELKYKDNVVHVPTWAENKGDK